MSSVTPSIGLFHSYHPLQTIQQRLHHFVPKLQTFSRQAYDRFKDALLGESENLKFLKNNPNLNDEECQTSIANMMHSSNPYGLEGHQLRLILKDCSDTQRKAVIFKALDMSGIEFEKVSQFIELDGDISEMALCLPKIHLSQNETFSKGIGKTFRVVLRFFPNFLDNVLKAFNVIDSVKSPETLWDFSAVMNIYFKIFMLPHALLFVVGTFVSSSISLFLITGGLILLSVIGICFYLKYRPCPNKLPMATNLSEEALKGNLEPVIGRDDEIKEVSAYLGTRSDDIRTNIFLVGPSGVGKTELVKGIAQKYRQKRIFSLSAPMITSGYGNIGDKLRMLLLDINNHHNEVILFIDELGDVIKRNSDVNLAGMLKPLLGRDGVQVIVAATETEYESYVIKEDALCERFKKITVKPTTEEQTIAILKSRMKNKGKKIRFEKGIETYIYRLCEKVQLPRTPVKILDLAINLVSSCNFEKFDSSNLSKLKIELAASQESYQDSLDNKQEVQEIVEKIKILLEKIARQKKEDQEKVQLALKTKKLIKMERECIRKRSRFVHQISKKLEALFIHRHVLPWIRNKIDTNLKLIPPEFPMQVNQKIIDEITALGII